MNKRISGIAIMLMFCVSVITAQTYEDLVVSALDYTEQKEYEAAEQSYIQAMRKEPANPGNVILMANLGTIQRSLGKLDEALVSYNVALTNHPKVSLLLHNRAALYCEMNRFDDALKDYNALLLETSDDVEALNRRALLFVNKREIIAAEHDFETAIKLAPDNLQAQSGMALIMKSREEWSEAEKAYSDLIYKYRDNADLYLQRAECYLNLSKLARTQEDLNKASSLGVDVPSLYILRGKLHLEQYDKLNARKNFILAKEKGADAEIIAQYLLLCK